MRGFAETASLMVRSGDTYIRYYAPAAKNMEPPQYAGKAEATCLTMALDLLDKRMGDVSDPMEFARFFAGFNLLLRANDEVVDEIKPFTDELVTATDLDTVPVFHKFAGPEGRYVTGQEGRQIALDSITRLIPGNSVGSIRRRAAIEERMASYTQAVTDVANNPEYHQGDVLPFPTAMRSREDVTALLGETRAQPSSFIRLRSLAFKAGSIASLIPTLRQSGRDKRSAPAAG